jgi:hypothetical protein
VISSDRAFPLIFQIFQNDTLLKEMTTASGDDGFLRNFTSNCCSSELGEGKERKREELAYLSSA